MARIRSWLPMVRLCKLFHLVLYKMRNKVMIEGDSHEHVPSTQGRIWSSQVKEVTPLHLKSAMSKGTHKGELWTKMVQFPSEPKWKGGAKRSWCSVNPWTCNHVHLYIHQSMDSKIMYGIAHNTDRTSLNNLRASFRSYPDSPHCSSTYPLSSNNFFSLWYFMYYDVVPRWRCYLYQLLHITKSQELQYSCNNNICCWRGFSIGNEVRWCILWQ